MTETHTPEYGFPLPSDQSRISKFPWYLRELSRTLEAKLPGAVSRYGKAEADRAEAAAARAERLSVPVALTVDDNVDSLESGAEFWVLSAGVAQALGLPEDVHGVIKVYRWAGQRGVVLFITRTYPARVYSRTYGITGTPESGWNLIAGNNAELSSRLDQTGEALAALAAQSAPVELTETDRLDDLQPGRAYRVTRATTATAMRLPEAAHGVIRVERWGSGWGQATFTTRTSPARVWSYAWKSGGVPESGWRLLSGPSPRPRPQVQWISLFQAGHGWTTPQADSVAPQARTDAYLAGTQSLRMAPAAGQADLLQSPPLDLDLTGRALVLWARFDSGDGGTEPGLIVSASDVQGRAATWRLMRPSNEVPHVRYGEWAQLRLLPEQTTGGTPDWSRITRIAVGTSAEAKARPRDWTVQGIGMADTEPKFSRGVVSIAFDDGEAEVLRAAREHLTPRGMAGTAYVMQYQSTQGWTRYLNPDQIGELAHVHGWTIGAHHLDPYLNMTDEQLAALWDSDRAWFKQMGLPEPRHMAWVQGRYDQRTINAARRHFTTARSIYTGVDTLPVGDPYRIRAISSVSDSPHPRSTGVAEIKTWLDRTAQSGGWLNLVFHRIGQDPTSNQSISWEAFAEILDAITARGMETRTYDQLFNTGRAL